MNWETLLPQEDGWYFWMQRAYSTSWMGGLVNICTTELGGWLCKDGNRRNCFGDSPLLTNTVPQVYWQKVEPPELKEITPEIIDSLEAGREMDKLIAEASGAIVISGPNGKYNFEASSQDAYDFRGPYNNSYTFPIKGEANYCIFLPYYSTRIPDAWKIIELFRRGWNDHAAACVTVNVYDDVCSEDIEVIIFGTTIAKVSATGNSFPLAVCRAVLKVAIQKEQT